MKKLERKRVDKQLKKERKKEKIYKKNFSYENYNNKKTISFSGFLKTIVKSIFHIISFPFRVILKILVKLIKRLKFSITFKISVSYLLLYITVILIVAAITTMGYSVYKLNQYKSDVMENDMDKITSSFPNMRKIESIADNDEIKSINIYDNYLNNIYSLKGYEHRYSKNIIVLLEKLINNKEYIFSSKFYYNNMEYYININYLVNDILSEAFRICIMIISSGAAGLFVFVPIVSRTSYKLIGPIKKMTEITKTITVNNINTRLDVKDTQDELKELSETFNEMMNRIEQGYKTQQQFVSDASHELRTPIAVIKGYVNMLDRWGKNDKDILEESINAIKNETDSMQDLIEKLLFIARSDKQSISFTKEDFKICEILFEIEKETCMIDTKHNFDFKFYDDASIYADKNRIKQAIRIFIENAIKFTPQNGYIKVLSYIDEDYYVIKVSDSGMGIEKKDLDKIFNRLYRAEQSRNKDVGGHGLGLSIAKIIILGHKGKIKVKSTVDKGSEFIILLPFLQKIS
ncbi:signal transduction histidine kinase [Sedimentibacter acidaminivorans]|uniref:histidine kinase n=1 Tax=Sedimentibacter acidaminivorans TaxID=913099 RepID=A0ABS4GHF8_9FIRM|nr:HAMP domain-containing sensor histidine kinase [Sedimentibacter acidaminivorans]MBP1927084.1 signal transduction histidine kinase [Sedimentibacter acidaminivorans]